VQSLQQKMNTADEGGSTTKDTRTPEVSDANNLPEDVELE